MPGGSFYEIKKNSLKNHAGKYSQPPGLAVSRAVCSILVDSTNSGFKIFGKNYVYPESFLLLFARQCRIRTSLTFVIIRRGEMTERAQGAVHRLYANPSGVGVYRP